jgi:DNA polymerase-1
MQWCELPEIKHESVGLEAELALYFPTWAEEIRLPNNASPEQLKEILENHGALHK